VWIWGWGSGLAGWRDKGRKERCQSGPVLILTLPLPSPFPFPEGGRHACAWLGYWLALKSYDERRWRPASVKAAAGAGAARQRTRPRRRDRAVGKDRNREQGHVSGVPARGANGRGARRQAMAVAMGGGWALEPAGCRRSLASPRSLSTTPTDEKWAGWSVTPWAPQLLKEELINVDTVILFCIFCLSGMYRLMRIFVRLMQIFVQITLIFYPHFNLQDKNDKVKDRVIAALR
jgi:hypothetical protein